MSFLFYRDATLEDLPQVVAIYNSTIESRMVTADLEPVTVESKMDWFHQHSAHKRPLWMVEEENKSTVGWVSLQSFYGRPAYDATVEISLYLDSVYMGKGLGLQILNYCIAVCPKLGIKTLLCFIFAHNIRSIKLFIHAGFQEWAHLPDIAILDGVERSLKIVGRRIG